jgi:hypothetical protein
VWEKRATQNYYLWPSTLTHTVRPANIDVYRRRLSLYKTNLPPRRFLSREIQAQYVGRPTSLLPDIVSTSLEMILCRSPALFILVALAPPSVDTKVYHARRHLSSFLTTSPVHFIYERLSTPFLEGCINDKGTSKLIAVTNGYVERVGAGRKPVGQFRNVDVIRRCFNLQEYSNEKMPPTLV